MYAIGGLSAFWLFIKLARQKTPEVPRLALSRLFVICYVSGYFGARLLSIVVEEHAKAINAGEFLNLLFNFGPMTFYGGAILSAVCGAIYARIGNLPIVRLFDCAVPSGLLALSIGRIGCFLNGDDYGTAVNLAPGAIPPFWAVHFPNLGDGLYRYPVQLMESFFAFIICLFGVRMTLRPSRPDHDGLSALICTAMYAFGRTFLEVICDLS